MTFVITHTEGHLACFTVREDGSLIQHALIDTGPMIQTPQQLVKLGLEMSAKYGWNGKQLEDPVERISRKAIERAKPKSRRQVQPKVRQGLQPGEPVANQRPAIIKAFLLSNPGSTTKEIILGAGLQFTSDIAGRWNHFMKRMVRDGELIEDARDKPFTYSLSQPPLTVRSPQAFDQQDYQGWPTERETNDGS